MEEGDLDNFSNSTITKKADGREGYEVLGKSGLFNMTVFETHRNQQKLRKPLLNSPTAKIYHNTQCYS